MSSFDEGQYIAHTQNATGQTIRLELFQIGDLFADTEKLDRYAGHVTNTESGASTGIAVLQLELKDEVFDAPEVWARVRDGLSDLTPSLPAGASPPELEDEEGV